MTQTIIVALILLLQHTTFSWILSSSLPHHGNTRVYQTAERSISSSTCHPEKNVPTLTVLIPAYNEEFRIAETLNHYSNYFANSPQWQNRTSIVVVDDGSSDETARVVRTCSDDLTNLPMLCLEMPTNQGKGAALAYGIQYIGRRKKNEWTTTTTPGLVLTADADGSARIEDVEVLFHAMQDELASTRYKNDNSCWKQALLINGFRTYDSPSALRLFFRWGFRAVVRVVCGDLQVQDTQCGFKLMTLPAAETLYSNLNLLGWSHDVEVLYRAKQRGIRVREASILWQDKDGSKLVSSPGGVLVVCAKMFGEVIRLRYNYEIGNWKL